MPKTNLQEISQSQPQTQKSFLTFKKVSVIIVILVLLTGTFGVGYLIGQDKTAKLLINTAKGSEKPGKFNYGNVTGKDLGSPEYLSKDVDFGLFWDVWNIVHNKYVDPVEDIKLFYGSLAGAVAALGDPYSLFLEPKITESFTEELQGKFEGIGAEIAIKKERLTIVAPLDDSPAQKAGLKAGDKVLMIDDYDTTGISLEEAVKRIRGPKGTAVTLAVMREENGIEPLKIAVTRDEIHFKSVKYEMKAENVGYIKVSHFNEDTTRNFQFAVENILKNNPRAIILDLRNNAGGYLEKAIDMASFWVDNNVIVIEKFGENYSNGVILIDNKRFYKSTLEPKLKGLKTIVLINKGSASASEIVAGALQDYGLATLVGETSFGKGSVQELEELKNGASVKITIAKWLTPKERMIDKEGIVPDIKVEMTNEDYNNDLDPQLDKALELLR